MKNVLVVGLVVFFIVSGVASWVAFPSAVQAQAVCGERIALVEKLKAGFNEAPRSMGLANNGHMVEVFASPKGSWTIIVTQPNGLACLLAAGENWEDLPRKKKSIGTKI